MELQISIQLLTWLISVAQRVFSLDLLATNTRLNLSISSSSSRGFSTTSLKPLLFIKSGNWSPMSSSTIWVWTRGIIPARQKEKIIENHNISLTDVNNLNNEQDFLHTKSIIIIITDFEPIKCLITNPRLTVLHLTLPLTN